MAPQARDVFAAPNAQSVLDALPSHVAVLDSDGTILTVNRAWINFARTNGAPDPVDTGPGTNYLTVVRAAPDDEHARAALAGITEVMDGARGEFTLEYPCFAPDTPRWFSMHVTPLQNGGVAIVHTDITERKLAEIRLEEALSAEEAARERTEAAERVLTAVVERVPIGIILINAAGEILLMNDAGRQIVGMKSPHEVSTLRNIKDWTLLDPETRAPMPSDTHPLARALTGESVASSEFMITRWDNHNLIRIVESAAPLQEPNGQVAGVVAVFSDVTRERELEEQRENFISNAAHDLKGPLTTIKGFAQLLRRQVERNGQLPTDRTIDTLRQIDQTATRLAAQIGELQDVSSIRTGKPIRLTLTPTHACDLVRRMVRQYQETTEDRVFHLHLPEEDIEANWDASRMERVLQNILSNAVKYSPSGSEIDVALTVDGDDIAISVRDHGIGIPAHDLPQVFERYFRASNVTERVSGTGIGLAGVRQIVEQHGGSVSVISHVGAGTTFTIRLPRFARDSEDRV